MKRLNLGIIIILPVIFFLITFFYWPLSKIIQLAVFSSLETWKQTFTNPLFTRFFSFTLIQSLITVLGTLVIGVPSGFLLARTKPYSIRLLRALITVPFLFPPLVILLGFVILFEPTGRLAQYFATWNFSPFSFWGIVMAHILYNVSIVARITEAAFSSEIASYHQLADTLGASKFEKIRSITLPHIRPALESAILLVFLYSFNSFAIVLILGEVKLQTIEVMIYNQSRLRFNLEIASILGLFQLFINLIVITIYSKRRSYQVLIDEGESLKPKNQRFLPFVILMGVIILTWSPVIMVFQLTIEGLLTAPETIQSQLLSGSYDRFLGTSSMRVLVNTIFFGISVALLSVVFSALMIMGTYFLKDRVGLEELFVPFTLLPMGTSAITISFAILQTHGSFNFFSELVWMYIISAQIISALPFASRAMFSSWKRVPHDLILVSESLGASYIQTIRQVIFPYMKSALLISFLFSFAISIGEFGATFYLVRGQWVTLSLAIDKLFASRNALLPNLYASILVITALVSFWIIERIGKLELKL